MKTDPIRSPQSADTQRVISPCPRCGGEMQIVVDGSIGLRPAPFVSCSSCEFCEEIPLPKLAAATLPPFPSVGLEIVKIRKVTPISTSNPKVTEYVVEAETLASPPRLRQYSTINAHNAALCSWCEESEWPAQVSWKRTRFGLNLVAVDKAARR